MRVDIRPDTIRNCFALPHLDGQVDAKLAPCTGTIHLGWYVTIESCRGDSGVILLLLLLLFFGYFPISRRLPRRPHKCRRRWSGPLPSLLLIGWSRSHNRPIALKENWWDSCVVEPKTGAFLLLIFFSNAIRLNYALITVSNGFINN